MPDAKVKKEKQYRDAKFPKGLKTIDAKEAAHYSGNQLYVKDIYIPASVERITKDAFTVLRGMTGSFIVDLDNLRYSSSGKALFRVLVPFPPVIFINLIYLLVNI